MPEIRPRAKHWVPNPDPSSIVVPGIDTSASVNDQIDHIDQLITIRLQNINANFARMQHVISAKLLPAFKRYAESTEPIREAAKFWKSFYEAAAQVRIPLATDASSLDRTEDHSSAAFESEILSHDKTPITSNLPDDSFVSGAPVSSTPLVRDPTGVPLPDEPDNSWAASIESPFERLGRQVKNLNFDETENNVAEPSTLLSPSFSPMHGNYSGNPRGFPPSVPKPPALSQAMPQVPQSRHKGKSPMPRDIPHQNPSTTAPLESSTPSRLLYTPHRVKTPKNPFVPPNSTPEQWNGLVDLRQPSPSRAKASRALHVPENSTSTKDFDYASDSSDDMFPPGMSPPVTIQFAMPSRVQRSAVKLALTPARRAAERISRDLVANAARNAISTKKGLDSEQSAKYNASTSSVAPSLPSLTRYSGYPITRGASVSNSSLGPLQDHTSQGETVTPVQPMYRLHMESSDHPDIRRLLTSEGPEASPGSDSDTKSPEHNESNPSAAYIFTQNNANDSFGSDSDDEDETRAARPALPHLFVEDSFTDAKGEDETVFGARQVGKVSGETQLRIMRDALIDDTNTGAASLNPFAQVDHSPSPYTGEAEDLR